MAMKIETELKFQVEDFASVQERLELLHAGHTPWYFEKNIVLDDDQGSLKSSSALLRLRTGLENKLTLKLPMDPTVSGLAKHRLEHETVVGNIRDMESILGYLGFKTWLSYEKFRQVWYWEEVKVCLDILPFGRFVEIEGDEAGIMNAAENLGLDKDKATAKTYHQLNQEQNKKPGSRTGDDFVFDPDRREYLVRELNIQNSGS